MEAALNVTIGYFVSLGVQLVVYPMFGAAFSFGQNVSIGLVFAAVAIVRSYIIRRWFNQHIHRLAMKV